MKKINGFTLAEILVVLGILSILGLIVLTIFTRALRGTNKTQVILSIKENGQSVLEIIDKAVRNADNPVVCPVLPEDQTTISSNTIVVYKEGTYTRYRISLPNDTTTSPDCSGNGCIAFDTPVPTAEETAPESFRNRVCNVTNSLVNPTILIGTDPLESPTVLTDTDPEKGVAVEEGAFSLDRKSGFKDYVNVKFILKAGTGAPAAVAGQIDPVVFETTIQLR